MSGARTQATSPSLAGGEEGVQIVFPKKEEKV